MREELSGRFICIRDVVAAAGEGPPVELTSCPQAADTRAPLNDVPRPLAKTRVAAWLACMSMSGAALASDVGTHLHKVYLYV